MLLRKFLAIPGTPSTEICGLGEDQVFPNAARGGCGLGGV